MTEVVEDGRKRDRAGRLHMPRERREELLGEYERSGLSQAAFARAGRGAVSDLGSSQRFRFRAQNP